MLKTAKSHIQAFLVCFVFLTATLRIATKTAATTTIRKKKKHARWEAQQHHQYDADAFADDDAFLRK